MQYTPFSVSKFAGTPDQFARRLFLAVAPEDQAIEGCNGAGQYVDTLGVSASVVAFCQPI